MELRTALLLLIIAASSVNGFPRAQEEPEDAFNSGDDTNEGEGAKSDYYAPGSDYSDYSYAEGYSDDDEYTDNYDQDINGQEIDPESYDESNYQYTDDEYAYEEYQKPDENVILPTFTSEPSRVLVDRGNTARLRCSANNLGEHIIFWKKLQDDGARVLSIGNLTLVEDSRISVTYGEGSSVLYLALVEKDDTGTYICEVSTNPALIQEHRIEIRAPAEVQISDYQEDIVIDQGDSLELECKGFGDPMPTIHWYRENKLLPDGSNKVEGDRLFYSEVTGKHSGIYTCSGDNGFGTPSTQSVLVNVKYAPKVILNHELKENQDLEIICAVQGFPEVSVSWGKDGGALPEKSEVMDEGDKHILRIPKTTNKDIGVYSCYAENSIGSTQTDIDLSENESLMSRISSEEDDSKDEHESELESGDSSTEDTVKSVDELLELEPAPERSGRAGGLNQESTEQSEVEAQERPESEYLGLIINNSNINHPSLQYLITLAYFLYHLCHQ